MNTSTTAINRERLFIASCFALITTSMAFGIRAGVLTQLGEAFNLPDTQLGYINQMAFLGFPIAMIIGGPLYNVIGPKRIVWVAFFTHLLGLIMTIFATGFWTLFISTFFVGFGNGTVEAACNPMIADMYDEGKTAKLNRFHMWFPGGIVIGALVSEFMTGAGLGWQLQMAIILLPTIAYGFLFFNQAFPESKAEGALSSGDNLKAMATPLYLFIAACMCLTAISEFGPQQWIERLLGSSGGAPPMVILALVTGLMATGRYFAGPIVHRINPTGVLLASAVVAAIGIFMMSIATGALVYVAAILFALGVCYFWPTMIGFVAEYIPRAGAFGMSIIGGIGMFSTSIFQPIIGGWIDSHRSDALAQGLSPEAAQLAAGQATLANMAIFPCILIVAFAGLFFFMRNKHHVNVPEAEILEQPQR
ncbi:Fucose permease [Catalinimonas alkaloidigena]|uniref:Fucose permease n=1 Tax=Catalinimonas alkaloidigena TaxID=1075417 RepID=A0A1G9QLG3_9BACT|nr:MFS transporter [Catalinimonas alkaloidigena]SDM11864.1 Fucose permease [Catalinimonas alkaloidigena]